MSKILKNMLSLRTMLHIRLALMLITPTGPENPSLANYVPPIAALTPSCISSARDVALPTGLTAAE